MKERKEKGMSTNGGGNRFTVAVGTIPVQNVWLQGCCCCCFYSDSIGNVLGLLAEAADLPIYPLYFSANAFSASLKSPVVTMHCPTHSDP